MEPTNSKYHYFELGYSPESSKPKEQSLIEKNHVVEDVFLRNREALQKAIEIKEALLIGKEEKLWKKKLGLSPVEDEDKKSRIHRVYAKIGHGHSPEKKEITPTRPTKLAPIGYSKAALSHHLSHLPVDRPGEASPLYFSWDKNHQVGIIIRQGDICQSSADIIVNAANRDLRKGGGISEAIHKAAGTGCEGIMQEKEAWKMKNGKQLMDVGTDYVLTSAGDLTKNGVKHILHVAGPDVRPDKQGPDQQKENWIPMITAAYDTCFATIEKFAADTNQDAVRIAIPVISGKIFGLDPNDSIGWIIAARDRFIQHRGSMQKPIILEFYTYEDKDMTLYLNTFSLDPTYPNLLK
jgi:O-acetyl-ADP-ribose deacetylase (regulator of RNase III)